MKLFIPTIGQILKLTSPWNVTLEGEYRNAAMIRAYGEDITFPVGTELSVDRIYIRQNAREYDSVTFKTVTEPKGRFWVKLAKANEVEFDLIASKLHAYRILKDNKEIVRSISLKGLIAKLKGNTAEWASHKTFKSLFYNEVCPLLTDWVIDSSYVGQTLREKDFATNMARTKIPIVQPVNKERFSKFHSYFQNINKNVGKTYTDMLGNVRQPLDIYYEVDPHKTASGFTRDFMKTLRKLKGVKSDEELLQHLPSGYTYEVLEIDN